MSRLKMVLNREYLSRNPPTLIFYGIPYIIKFWVVFAALHESCCFILLLTITLKMKNAPPGHLV